MAKSAEAIDTVSLSETSEAVSQVFNSFMDGIHQGFNPFQSCELASDRKTLRSDYYGALDQSVKAVWLALEEHEICEDWGSLRELPQSLSKSPDAISFQLAYKKGRDIEPNETNPDGYTTKGDPVVCVTVISKSQAGVTEVTNAWTGETFTIDDKTAEVEIKYETVGIADIPLALFADGADFMLKLQIAVTAYRRHNPLDREFSPNVDLDTDKRLAEAGF